MFKLFSEISKYLGYSSSEKGISEQQEVEAPIIPEQEEIENSIISDSEGEEDKAPIVSDQEKKEDLIRRAQQPNGLTTFSYEELVALERMYSSTAVELLFTEGESEENKQKVQTITDHLSKVHAQMKALRETSQEKSKHKDLFGSDEDDYEVPLEMSNKKEKKVVEELPHEVLPNPDRSEGDAVVQGQVEEIQVVENHRNEIEISDEYPNAQDDELLDAIVKNKEASKKPSFWKRVFGSNNKNNSNPLIIEPAEPVIASAAKESKSTTNFLSSFFNANPGKDKNIAHQPEHEPAPAEKKKNWGLGWMRKDKKAAAAPKVAELELSDALPIANRLEDENNNNPPVENPGIPGPHPVNNGARQDEDDENFYLDEDGNIEHFEDPSDGSEEELDQGLEFGRKAPNPAAEPPQEPKPPVVKPVSPIQLKEIGKHQNGYSISAAQIPLRCDNGMIDVKQYKSPDNAKQINTFKLQGMPLRDDKRMINIMDMVEKALKQGKFKDVFVISATSQEVIDDTLKALYTIEPGYKGKIYLNQGGAVKPVAAEDPQFQPLIENTKKDGSLKAIRQNLQNAKEKQLVEPPAKKAKEPERHPPATHFRM